MLVRGLRGVPTATANAREDIVRAVAELTVEIVRAHDPGHVHLASRLFTTPPDRDVAFPAVAARDAGRMRVHTDRAAGEIHNDYAHGARVLRRDLVEDAQLEAAP